jgi:hypothetical protein
MKYLASCRRILLAHQNAEQGFHQGQARVLVPDRRSFDSYGNACGLKRALYRFCLGSCSTVLSDCQLTFGDFMGGMKHLASGGGVFFTNQHLEPETTPCQMIAHAAGSIGLDHGINAGGFEFALRKVGFDLRGEGINDHEFAVIHAMIIHLDAIEDLGARRCLRVLQGWQRLDFA